MSASLKKIVERGVQQADFLLQPYFCLTQELFVEDPTATAGAGFYTAEDWSRHRQLRAEPFGASGNRYTSDAEYRHYLSSIHEGKILSVQSLIRAFDFGEYSRIIELGCGDMPQAFVICSHFPSISYTATDFDPYVIERCSQLPLLGGIRKFVLDVVHADLDELKNHDLVISWSLEFSLENRHLTKLFAACKKYSLPYLLCTHTAIGPISYLSRARSLKKQKQLGQENGLTLLGWLRSIGEIARMAKHAGMSLRCKSYHVNHAALFFTP